MTRINYGVLPNQLTDKVLNAAAREIKRVPSLLSHRITNHHPMDDIPKAFTFGKGHELYFLDKGAYTLQAYLQIYGEQLLRGVNCTCFRENWKIYEEHLQYFNHCIPTEEDVLKTQVRLITRLHSYKSDLKYYGHSIEFEDAVQLILDPTYPDKLKQKLL